MVEINKQLKLNFMKNLKELNENELLNISGGEGFWGDLAYGIAYTLHSAYEIAQLLKSDSRHGNAMIYK
jgi:bacteriocin-like protein